MNSNSIVVYRSEIERMQDEFWMDFLSSNASWLQYIFIAFYIFVACFTFSMFCYVIYNMFKSRKSYKQFHKTFKR